MMCRLSNWARSRSPWQRRGGDRYFDRAIAPHPQRRTTSIACGRSRHPRPHGRSRCRIPAAQQHLSNDDATVFNLGRASIGSETRQAPSMPTTKRSSWDPHDASLRLALGTSLERLECLRDAAAVHDEGIRAFAPPDAEKVALESRSSRKRRLRRHRGRIKASRTGRRAFGRYPHSPAIEFSADLSRRPRCPFCVDSALLHLYCLVFLETSVPGHRSVCCTR